MEGDLQTLSLQLYQHLCYSVIGSEDLVQTLRLLTSMFDEVVSTSFFAVIISGSIGEGLQMRGSDYDIMLILKTMDVSESELNVYNHYNQYKTSFLVETGDIKPGFAHLRLLKNENLTILGLCKKFKEGVYLSNTLFKEFFIVPHEVLSTFHGPCLSDIDEIFDIACCVHSRNFITTASHWPLRPNNGWPSAHVKKMIVDHGVLFVPIGIKGSRNVEFEWRVSFSVSEKILIFSFSHTQLICYALMKILLKKVIDRDPRCKGLLCSYFIKTIIFWVFEETITTEWRPSNLIQCFMKCLKKLIYCVKYMNCPHYFIPEYNLFENKFSVIQQDILLRILYQQFNNGWSCLLHLSKFSYFQKVNNCPKYSHLMAIYNDFNILKFRIGFLTLYVTGCLVNITPIRRTIRKIICCSKQSHKRLYFYVLCSMYLCYGRILSKTKVGENKKLYREYKTIKSLLVQSVNTDAVTGWMSLGTLFYNMKLYNEALHLMEYALSKCTFNMINSGFDIKLSLPFLKETSILLDLFKGFTSVLRYRYAADICLTPSMLTPVDIYQDIVSLLLRSSVIPPVVYGHFLCFLCHYHRNDVRQYRCSVNDLKVVIEEGYFIGYYNEFIGVSYYLLGVALQMVGDNISASDAFRKSIYIWPVERDNSSFRRLLALSFNCRR